ncbi:hypothetical protein PPL_10867 [Heterostelium album PN500]|uniref:FNIP repeat-containing protein n=1 Tax=Heterostelium pallidum (strain ATCC 26659 / Pp 5 / PN500) TaxID=670386 RepID=D3BS75_HETP5|nr:hypothetical protein PPL_10867 [Heterostelium album PN500]EFA75812.1 hypothetical protein PPL_10867 [Heterostelium album PN500]|eukprot:XP_020427946.1 hypothetical protein PPL_10867 [Heterostelium album PN500]
MSKNKKLFIENDNIDIICFSLVCKRWYNERDKYLIFNTDLINLFALKNTNIYQNNEHFKLPSYHNIFLKSIQSKMNCKLVLSKSLYQYQKYDYHYGKLTVLMYNYEDDSRKLKSIPSNVSTIYNYTENIQENIYRLLSESQSVTKFDGCGTLKYGLPKSIKSIRFKYDFDEPLVKGSLPNSLEVLKFNAPIEQEIPPGVLPDGLVKLTLTNYEFVIPPGVLPNGLYKLNLDSCEYEIPPGVLPYGLRKLNLSSYQYEVRPGVLPSGLLELILGCKHEIQAGVLPNGLQKFTLDGYQYEIQPGVLPSSLKHFSLCDTPLNDDLQYTIDSTTFEDSVLMKSCLPISWLQAISSLSNLQSLDIYVPKHNRQDITVFNVNYLPRTLESLYLRLQSKDSVLKGTMPTSLRIFHLDHCQFKVDEIFPETKQYYFEVFDFGNDNILPIPSNIKIDTLFISGEPRESTISLPSRIRSISLFMEVSGSNENIFDFGNTDQTCSLKELRLPTFKEGAPKVKLPNTIEYMDIGKNFLDDLHLIPPTLNTLVFRNLSKINNTVPETIKSITNIIHRFESYQTQTIRKLDDNYYFMCSENDISPKGNLIAKIFHQSKFEKILRGNE